jgi:hypothetical protein
MAILPRGLNWPALKVGLSYIPPLWFGVLRVADRRGQIVRHPARHLPEGADPAPEPD